MWFWSEKSKFRFVLKWVKGCKFVKIATPQISSVITVLQTFQLVDFSRVFMEVKLGLA